MNCPVEPLGPVARVLGATSSGCPAPVKWRYGVPALAGESPTLEDVDRASAQKDAAVERQRGLDAAGAVEAEKPVAFMTALARARRDGEVQHAPDLAPDFGFDFGGCGAEVHVFDENCMGERFHAD